jgi:uncharacterized membrane protein
VKARLARGLALGGYFGLLALMTAWLVWIAPSAHLPISLVLVVAVFPLLLPLRGLLHGRPRAHVWAAFLSLPYFVHGVGEAFAGTDERWLGVVEVGLSLTLFFGASLYARWQVATAPERTRV